MPLPWMKMWLEALDDPKLTRLTLAEKGAWWGLLKVGHRCNAGGKLISGGSALDIDEIADALHIKTTEDRSSLESMLKKMEERHSLLWNEGHVLTIVNWEKRQSVPPSSMPEAIAERVRLHRERQQKGSPQDPSKAEFQNLFGLAYRKKKKELGRDLTEEERIKIRGEVDRQLKEKGR